MPSDPNLPGERPLSTPALILSEGKHDGTVPSTSLPLLVNALLRACVLGLEGDGALLRRDVVHSLDTGWRVELAKLRDKPTPVTMGIVSRAVSDAHQMLDACGLEFAVDRLTAACLVVLKMAEEGLLTDQRQAALLSALAIVDDAEEDGLTERVRSGASAMMNVWVNFLRG